MHSLALFIYLFFVIKQQSIIFMLINNKSCRLNLKKYIKQKVHYIYYYYKITQLTFKLNQFLQHAQSCTIYIFIFCNKITINNFFAYQQQVLLFEPQEVYQTNCTLFLFYFQQILVGNNMSCFFTRKIRKIKLHINYYYLRHLVPSKKTNTNYYLTYQLLLLRSFCAKQENKNQIFLKQKLLQDFLQQETKKDKNNLFQQQFRGKLRLGTLAAMLDMIVHVQMQTAPHKKSQLNKIIIWIQQHPVFDFMMV
eukprot:TRINITY_DN6994_c0_g1_i1.p1 TRINITY_DN6994_c0_g1~~TRINITY_DN6994_c0_g1_i1.p1  ORF type:complete len:251 (+),score=-18.69 TRINITY_DN6994_c0_g1_i1:545-1297(+)